MLRCCLGAYGCPNHAWMPSLGAGLIRLSQLVLLLLLLLLLLRRRCPTAVGSRRPFSPEGRKHAPARSTHAARQKAAAWLHHPKLSAGYKSP